MTVLGATIVSVVDQTGSIYQTEPPIGWPPDQLNVALCRFEHGEDYPGLGMQEPYPNWSEFQTFAFDLMPERNMPRRLHIRIHDRDHDQEYYDRFNTSVVIEPGFQTIRIPIEEIRNGPRNRDLDLTRISNFKLFFIRPKADIEFFIGNFRLE